MDSLLTTGNFRKVYLYHKKYNYIQRLANYLNQKNLNLHKMNTIFINNGLKPRFHKQYSIENLKYSYDIESKENISLGPISFSITNKRRFVCRLSIRE